MKSRLSYLYKKYKFINFNPKVVHISRDYIQNKINNQTQQPTLLFEKDPLTHKTPILLQNLVKTELSMPKPNFTIPAIGVILAFSNIFTGFPIYPYYVDYITAIYLIRNYFKQLSLQKLSTEIKEIHIKDSNTLIIKYESNNIVECLIKDFVIDNNLNSVLNMTTNVLQSKLKSDSIFSSMLDGIIIQTCFVNGKNNIIKITQLATKEKEIMRDICDYDMLLYLLRENTHSIKL